MRVYDIRIQDTRKDIYGSALKLGGHNGKGDSISFTNYYMELNGKPFFGICCEFHFSRCPSRHWEEEILKIKASGGNIISTYIFWNHHEEEEGIFVWNGDRNLRGFVKLCARHDMYVILRIGPFNHGEVRNGGLPDWLYGRPFAVRSNDEGYVRYVKRFFTEVGKQVSGNMFKDNGAVIGIQLENEHMHASPPWEFMVMKEYEWVGNGRDGAGHIRLLKELAMEAGMEAPIYTCTGWGGASFLEDETLPLYGGYSFCPWEINEQETEHKPTNQFLMQSFHDRSFRCIEFKPPYDAEKYPYACCELGGGMACWYRYRFVVPPESVEAATIVKIAGGCNFIGYYMFRDGTNPIGKHGYMNERNVPKMSYDFQAPIGEYGQIRASYRRLKLIFYFLKEYEKDLCLMGTVLPEGAEKIAPSDDGTLRYGIRHRDGSGFVFMTNYQDHFSMKDQKEVVLNIGLPKEEIRIGGAQGFALRKNVSAILPFNMDVGGALLKYSTAQPVTHIQDGDASTYFFFTPEGMAGEYCFDASTIQSIAASQAILWEKEGLIYIASDSPREWTIEITGKNGNAVILCTLTREQALGLWKYDLWGQERVIVSKGDISAQEDFLEIRRTGNPDMSFSIYPPVEEELRWKHGELISKIEGIFQTFQVELPKKDIQLHVERVGDDKAVINISPYEFEGLEEIYLSIDYLGNVGNAFVDGVLVGDNFCNGKPWEIGLKRLLPKLGEKGMYLHIIPFIKGSDVVFDRDIGFKHELSGDRVADIFSIEAAPQYKARINRA